MIPAVLGAGKFLWLGRIPSDPTATACRFRLDSDHPSDAAAAYLAHIGSTGTTSKVEVRRIDDAAEAVPPGPRPAAAPAA